MFLYCAYCDYLSRSTFMFETKWDHAKRHANSKQHIWITCELHWSIKFHFSLLTNSICSDKTLVMHSVCVLVCYDSIQFDPVYSAMTVARRGGPFQNRIWPVIWLCSLCCVADKPWAVVHWYIARNVPRGNLHELIHGTELAGIFLVKRSEKVNYV